MIVIKVSEQFVLQNLLALLALFHEHKRNPSGENHRHLAAGQTAGLDSPDTCRGTYLLYVSSSSTNFK